MPDQAPPQPQAAGAPPAGGPAPPKKPTAIPTSADIAANMPNFTVGELVELALCAPEIGAVNFNILRLLLRDMIDKTGIDKQPVKLNDLEAHQIENFKNYVQGASVPSPMPGVLKIGPHGPTGTGMAYGAKGATSNQKMTPRTPKTGLPPVGGQPDFVPNDLAEKVARLEKHLDALYQLPTNADILEKAKTDMSVNDMWQIIQLNNRIAAAEAAIQKMASLIEDLARNMNRVKGDTKSIKKDADDLALTNSDLQIQGNSLSDKFNNFADVINGVRKDIEKIKKGWKNDRDLLEKTLGVDLGRVPSFMKPKPERGDATTGGELGERPSQQFDRGTQTFVHLKDKDKPQDKSTPRPGKPGQEGGGEKGRPDKGQPGEKSLRPKPVKPVQEQIAPQEIAKMTPSEIVKDITPEEVENIPSELLQKMTPDQKKAVENVRKSMKFRPSPPPKPPMGVAAMDSDELSKLQPEKIADKMSYEEASKLPPEVLNKMSEKQRQAVQKVIDKGPPPQRKVKSAPPPKPAMGVAAMNADQLASLQPDDIAADMAYEEAANIPPEVLEKMTDKQKDAIKKVIVAGPPPPAEEEYFDDADDDGNYEESPRSSFEAKRPSKEEKRRSTKTTEELKALTNLQPFELAAKMSPETAALITSEELAKFSPDQIKEIEKLRAAAPKRWSQEPKLDLDKVTTTQISNMTPSQLIKSLTGEQLLDLTQDQLDKMTEEQQQAVKDASRRVSQEQDEYLTEDQETDREDQEGSVYQKGGKDKQKQRPRKEKPHHKHHHHHEHHTDSHHHHHPHVDVVKGPIPTMGEPLPPMSLEQYLASLPPEEAANLAADAVQRELTKQYANLQGMQRQLAQDIQEKMEFIYQKLLREIAAQQLTTSPYMAVGGPEQCLGPGICTGHGMPAGIAVCQFSEAQKDKMAQMIPGGAAIPGGIEDGKVCPGPGICPGNAVCTVCQGQGQVPQGQVPQEGLLALKAPERKPGEIGGPTGPASPRRVSELDEALLKEMKSLMLLDLEKIREDMRSRKFGAFDEKDIVERLGAVWEALKILKHNEEALAVKIARLDAVMKKIPLKTIEKLNKIPEENLDAIATGQFQKPMYLPEGSPKHNLHKEGEDTPKSPMRSIASAADKEDIQTLFNNLANVIAECTEQKDRIDQLADTARIMESGMVTKQMLLDSLSDKADKGLINTKVSYDEFGNTVDELHTQLHNLMVEGYQRNENWKKVTADLAEELAEKLDKVEIAPIRAFFKSHLKNLEDKVKNLSHLIEEPDPAGTRKRLLRDYNCLSCDRMVNISGVTNGPTLPIIGPILAGHSTASRRALDLHRLRMKKQFDPDTKNLNAMERQTKGQKSGKKPSDNPDPAQLANDVDVMHVVNRYTGGSHTAITNGDRLASQRKPSNATNPAVNPPVVSGGGGSVQ